MVNSLGMLIPALWVPLDFTVVQCTLGLQSRTSGRVIVDGDFRSGRVLPFFKGHSSADDSSPQIGIVACLYGSW